MKTSALVLAISFGLLAASAGFAQVDATTAQKKAIERHAHPFLGNYSYTSTPNKGLNLVGGGVIEFWINPTWTSPMPYDQYVLSCTVPGRQHPLYSVCFTEDENGLLNLVCQFGDGEEHWVKINSTNNPAKLADDDVMRMNPADDNYYYVAIIASTAASQRGVQVYIDNAQLPENLPKSLFGMTSQDTSVKRPPRLTIGANGPGSGQDEGLQAKISGLRIFNDYVDWNGVLRSRKYPLRTTAVDNLLYPPHPRLLSLVGYSDFVERATDNNPHVDFRYWHPLAGKWVSRDVGRKTFEDPNNCPLAVQFRISDYPIYCFEPSPAGDALLVYEDGVYFGYIVELANRIYELRREVDGKTARLRLDLQEDGTLRGYLRGLPFAIAGETPGGNYTAEASFKLGRASEWSEARQVREWNVVTDNWQPPADNFNWDKAVKHSSIVYMPFDISTMDPFNFNKDRGVQGGGNKPIFGVAVPGGETTDEQIKDLVKSCPVDVDMFELRQATSSSENFYFATSRETHEALSARAGFSVKVPKIGRIGAESSYSEKINTTRGIDTTTAMSRGMLEMYAVSLNRERAQLNDYYRQAVLELAVTEDFAKFFKEYGTHYCYSATIGGLKLAMLEIDTQNYVLGISQELSLDVEIGEKKGEKSAGGVSGGSTGGSETKETTEIKTERWELKGLGGDVIADQEEQQMTISDESCVPIHCDLRPQYELFSPFYFPGQPEVYLYLRERMRQEITDYVTKNSVLDLRPEKKLVTLELAVDSVEYKHNEPGWGKRLQVPLEGSIVFESKQPGGHNFVNRPLNKGMQNWWETRAVVTETEKRETSYITFEIEPWDGKRDNTWIDNGGTKIFGERKNTVLYTTTMDDFEIKVRANVQIGKSGAWTAKDLGAAELTLKRSDFPIAEPTMGAFKSLKMSKKLLTGDGTATFKLRLRQVPPRFASVKIGKPDPKRNPESDPPTPNPIGQLVAGAGDPLPAASYIRFNTGVALDLVSMKQWKPNGARVLSPRFNLPDRGPVIGGRPPKPQVRKNLITSAGTLRLNAKSGERPRLPLTVDGLNYEDCAISFYLKLDAPTPEEQATYDAFYAAIRRGIGKTTFAQRQGMTVAELDKLLFDIEYFRNLTEGDSRLMILESPNREIGLYWQDHRLVFGVGGSQFLDISYPALTPGKWHKCLVSIDAKSNTIQAALDGQIYNPIRLPQGVTIAKGDPARNGLKFYPAYGIGVAGELDELLVFKRALTNFEILQDLERPRELHEPLPKHEFFEIPARRFTYTNPPFKDRDLVAGEYLIAYHTLDGNLYDQSGHKGGSLVYAGGEATYQDWTVDAKGQQLTWSGHGDLSSRYPNLLDLDNFAFSVDFKPSGGPANIVKIGGWLSLDVDVANKLVATIKTEGGGSKEFTLPLATSTTDPWRRAIVSFDGRNSKFRLKAGDQQLEKHVIFVIAPQAFDPLERAAEERLGVRKFTFAGAIPVDEFMVFNRGLTVAEMGQLAKRRRIDPNAKPLDQQQEWEKPRMWKEKRRGAYEAKLIRVTNTRWGPGVVIERVSDGNQMTLPDGAFIEETQQWIRKTRAALAKEAQD